MRLLMDGPIAAAIPAEAGEKRLMAVSRAAYLHPVPGYGRRNRDGETFPPGTYQTAAKCYHTGLPIAGGEADFPTGRTGGHGDASGGMLRLANRRARSSVG
jgi:hypothetical protein